MKDYYKILEIDKSSNLEQIKKSYRRLAKLHHPDKNLGDNISDIKFKEISEAYEVLSNFEKRERYDSEYSTFFESNNSNNENWYNYKTNVDEIITPQYYLQLILQLKNQIELIGIRFINQRFLYDAINSLLNEEYIKIINKIDDSSIKEVIIEEIILCCKPLFYDKHPIYSFIYVENIKTKLLKIAGTESKLIKKINTSIRQIQVRSFIREYRGILIFIFVIMTFIIYALISQVTNNSYNSNYNKNRPKSGEIKNTYSNNNSVNNYEKNNSYLKASDSKNKSNYNNSKINDQINKLPAEDYSDWESLNYKSGNSPNCYNYAPIYDYSLDNKLLVIVGSKADVVIKLCEMNSNKCIRYVYIRSGESYNIKNIPEGKYYLKIAYGRDWRQKIISNKCVGKFIINPLYEKGNEILDFNKVYKGKTVEGDYEYENFEIPSYSLKLDVISSSNYNSFISEKITENEFNN